MIWICSSWKGCHILNGQQRSKELWGFFWPLQKSSTSRIVARAILRWAFFAIHKNAHVHSFILHACLSYNIYSYHNNALPLRREFFGTLVHAFIIRLFMNSACPCIETSITHSSYHNYVSTLLYVHINLYTQQNEVIVMIVTSATCTCCWSLTSLSNLV